MKRTLFLALCLLSLGCCAVSAAEEPPELPPGATIGVTPGYTRHEPGHWEKTDTLYFGSPEEARKVDGVTVAARFADTDNGTSAVYTFTDESGAETVFTVESYWFADRYYADDSFAVGVNILRDPDGESAIGGVSASLAVADVTPGEGKFGYQPTVRSYFKKANGEIVEKFGLNENMTYSEGSAGKYYIDLRGSFPAGETDGEKIYAVLGVQDDLDRGTRLFIAREYTWAAEPEDIEVPPEYGPIEYHNGPAGISPFLLAVPAVLVVVVIVGFAARRKRK